MGHALGRAVTPVVRAARRRRSQHDGSKSSQPGREAPLPRARRSVAERGSPAAPSFNSSGALEALRIFPEGPLQDRCVEDVVRHKNGLLASISDARAAQYWDPKHLVSNLVISSAWAKKEGIFTHGEESSGKVVAWDLILLFPPGSCAGGGLPEPVFHGNPVVTRSDEARDRLRALVH